MEIQVGLAANMMLQLTLVIVTIASFDLIFALILHWTIFTIFVGRASGVMAAVRIEHWSFTSLILCLGIFG